MTDAFDDSVVDELLEQPCWVIDFLPHQVPADGPGRYFAVEAHFLESPQAQRLFRRFADVLLKLNCYHDLRVCVAKEGAWELNPAPTTLRGLVEGCATQDRTRQVNVVVEPEGALVTLDSDSLNMAVFGASEGLLGLLRQLASAEGLFVWQP